MWLSCAWTPKAEEADESAAHAASTKGPCRLRHLRPEKPFVDLHVREKFSVVLLVVFLLLFHGSPWIQKHTHLWASSCPLTALGNLWFSGAPSNKKQGATMYIHIHIYIYIC